MCTRFSAKLSCVAFFFLIFVLCFSAASQSSVAQSASPQADPVVWFPLLLNSSPALQPIVVDHRHTDISKIPAYWIAQAKALVVHYAHTSHGSQVLSGLSWLEGRDSVYNVDIHVSYLVELPDDDTALRIYDGNNIPGDDYIEPEDYWETTDGQNYTRSVADTGWFDFSLWTWCGQMTYYNDLQIQSYIDVMAQFENEYPAMRFIYYTGHTDGTTAGSPLWVHNNMVRQYVQNNAKVLFDFADIESYDPAGTFYPTMDGTEGCLWCASWCAAHPTNFECQSVPSCAHSHGLQCTLKGQAFWWLMARLAGWDGVTLNTESTR